MLCANPDVVVERGDRLVYCAGAIADALCRAGRRGVLCRQAAPAALRPGAGAGSRGARAARRVALKRVLAIGDSVRTDLTGAADLGVDCLFVTAGIHAEELGHRDDPDLDGARRDVRGGARCAEGGDAKADVVSRRAGVVRRHAEFN